MLLVILVLAGAVVLLWKRLNDVTARQAELASEHRRLRLALESLEKHMRGTVPPPAPATPSPPALALPELPSPLSLPASGPSSTPIPEPTHARPATGPTPSHAKTASPQPVSEPDSLTASSRWVTEFFTTGNVVAKVGMVIVFFGVAFLLRYAAERGMLPIEYRLTGTAGAAVGMLALGWRLRRSRTEYAVVLQGGGVGVLYLTIFAAFRLYGLLPVALTFTLLLVVVACSAALAVAQNAMSLAVLGTSGGFLAPILASTGAGSHVGLFSYYAVLNAGVVWIAWFRAWRFLHWLAFVFTVAIGLVWGRQYYQPALFSTTQPFLMLFFLLFLLVAVIFAHRQPPQLRGYIDGSLVFGTPAVAFGMQSVLVQHIPYARAYSAVVLSALYLAVARTLWRRDALRALAEAFLALAVVFLVIAIPLAFDGHATAAAWALEGVGLVWIGTRQHRRLTRLAGVSLLIGAGLAFAVMSASSSETPVMNTRFLGCVAIAAASLIAGRLMSRAHALLIDFERPFEWVLLAWGFMWWFGAVTAEIAEHVPPRLIPAAMLLAVAGSGFTAGLLARRWEWRAMMIGTISIGPATWLPVVPLFVAQGRSGPLADLGWLAWTAVLAVNYMLLFWFEVVWPSLIVKAWHTATTWLFVLLTTWSIAVVVRQTLADASIWSSIVWCLIPGLFVLALHAWRHGWAWPLRAFSSVYAVIVPTAPVGAMLVWVVWACTQAGASDPLPYVPLLNPAELTQAYALIVTYAWSKAAPRTDTDAVHTVLRPIVAGLTFLALNAMVGRLVHFYLDVPFEIDNLLRSAIFQTGISILWGVVAGVLMTMARLRLERPVWMAGAVLLGALTLKLFVVDLGNVGGLARIVSFLATGGVILLIGYFAPAPPRAPVRPT